MFRLGLVNLGATIMPEDKFKMLIMRPVKKKENCFEFYILQNKNK